MDMRRWFLLVVVALGLALVGTACGDDDDDDNGDATAEPTASESGETPPAEGALRVVSTVSPITSIVENMGCGHIDLEGIVPEGVNSHTFEPAPSVAETIAGADLIIMNGLVLEEPTLEMAEANKHEDAQILLLGDNTITEDEWKFDFSFPESEGNPNPHLWPNPLLALEYAALVRDTLVQMDPPNAADYEANYAAFEARITDMDNRMAEATQTVPEENRKLLTYHDSWAYWAPEYGFTVIGAVQPSDFAEPSAQEVADLIDQIEEENIPAVFGSEVFPSDVLEQIASETGAEFVDELRDDDLPGAPGDPDHSYLGLMTNNMRIMLPPLGGTAAAFEAYDTSLVCSEPTEAVYPQ
jgi:ABC-type Zn uptake system ZnuABC Zn-binding protein ZnuA